MYNIYAIVILILFDIPLFSVNSLHQFQVAAVPRFPEVVVDNPAGVKTKPNYIMGLLEQARNEMEWRIAWTG